MEIAEILSTETKPPVGVIFAIAVLRVERPGAIRLLVNPIVVERLERPDEVIPRTLLVKSAMLDNPSCV